MELDITQTKIGHEIAQTRTQNDIKENLAKAMNSLKPNFDVMASNFLSIQPLYYDNAMLWWAWSFQRTAWELIDDIDVLNLIRPKGDDRDFVIFRKDYVLTALRLAARANKPKEMPSSWIQFREIIIDINDGSIRAATPAYFCVNAVPWKVGLTSNTPNIDKLFQSWVEPRFVPTLYDILAYCALADLPINRAFFFAGTGSNGKTKYQKLVKRFVGAQNICASSLTSLEKDTFAKFNLYKKLVCHIGETNYDHVGNSETFKNLTGGDPVEFQKKFKDSITAINYAKLLINSNGLPTPNDDADGMWRRILPIEFPNKFVEGPCPIDAITDEEMECLAKKVTEILPVLLKRANFSGEGTMEERKKRYMSLSNPLDEFLAEGYEKGVDDRVKYNFLFDDYKRWLSAHKRRIVKRNEFKEALIQEGYDIDKQRPGPNEDMTWVVVGLKAKTPLEKFNTIAQKETLDDGKNKQLVSSAIETPKELLAFIAERKFTSHQELLDAIPLHLKNREKFLSVNLKVFSKRGDIFENPKDTWRVLE